MAEQEALPLSEEEQQLYRWYAVERLTQREIGSRLGITQQAVAQRLDKVKAKLPPIDLGAVRQEMMALYAENLRRLSELAAMEGAPVTAGKDGDVVYDPESETVVRDYSGRVAAIKELNATTAHIRKLLGIDAAEKHEVTGAVRYELVGVDPEDLK